MRDVVVEKSAPIFLLIVVIWYLDAPRHVVRRFLSDVCLNASNWIAILCNFFY